MYPATSDYYQLRTPVGHEFTERSVEGPSPGCRSPVVVRTGPSAGSLRSASADNRQLRRSWISSPSATGWLRPARSRPVGQQAQEQTSVHVGPDDRARCEIAGGRVTRCRSRCRAVHAHPRSSARPCFTWPSTHRPGSLRGSGCWSGELARGTAAGCRGGGRASAGWTLSGRGLVHRPPGRCPPARFGQSAPVRGGTSSGRRAAAGVRRGWGHGVRTSRLAASDPLGVAQRGSLTRNERVSGLTRACRMTRC